VWSNPWNTIQNTDKEQNFMGLCPIQHRSNMLIVWHDRLTCNFFRHWYLLSDCMRAIKTTISLCCSVIKPMKYLRVYLERQEFHRFMSYTTQQQHAYCAACHRLTCNFFRHYYCLSDCRTTIKPKNKPVLYCNQTHELPYSTPIKRRISWVYVLYSTEATCLLCGMTDWPVIFFVTDTDSVITEQQ
jgi:hypothetical protein